MTRDELIVLLIGFGCSLAVALLGVTVLRLTRARSLAVGTLLGALISVATVVAGLVGTALAMFSSLHDLRVLLLVTIPAAGVAAAVAVVMGRRLAAEVVTVALVAAGGGDAGVLPAELSGLAAELGSARKRLEEGRLREQTLEASRRELVAWVSHDLRTPLAGMRAMAEALEDRVVADPTTVARYHRRIREDVERLSGMVNDLFDLSLVQSQALPITPAILPLSDLVGAALSEADPLAGAKGVRLEGSAEAGLSVAADAARLGRVLANLLVNAIRHSPAGSRISVVGSRDGRFACLAVTDACGGIPAVDLPRVFDVAFRGQPARTLGVGTDGQAGAGLGLAIASGIVQAHHGDLTVANVPGGCRFLIRLPTTETALPRGATAR